jgi:L-fuculose-phosphate aldolase
MLWEKQLTPGADYGDTSLRDPETGHIYICPRVSGRLSEIPNWGCIKADDIVAINRDGEVIDGKDILPTVEAPMHLHIYKARPDVNAIVHSHALWSSAFAVSRQDVPLITADMVYSIGGEVKCAEYGPVASVQLAVNIVKALGDRRKAALMANHGAVCVGRDFEEAFFVSDMLEKSAQVAIMGSILGRPVILPPEEIGD